MSMIDQLLGRAPLGEDSSVPPVMAARPQRPAAVRREAPKDEEEEGLKKKAARQRSVVASIMGMTESDDEGIIPDDAEPIDTLTGGEHIPGIRSDPIPQSEGPAEPSATTNAGGEELIQPTAALVAPDVTPNVMKPIDPSQVPAPPKQPERPAPPAHIAAQQQPGSRGVMDVVLGRQNSQSQPQGIDPEAAAAMAESMVANMANPIDIQEKVAEVMTPVQPGVSAMPEHREGDGRTVYGAFRRFMG